MRQTTRFLIVGLLLLNLFSCKKEEQAFKEHPGHDDEVTARFFSPGENIDPITHRVLNEIRTRNNIKSFVPAFARSQGFPVWNKAIIANEPGRDTVVYIPLVLKNKRHTNGFIRATMNGSITISSFESSDYSKYPFDPNAAYNADSYASFLMYFDHRIFGHEQFVINDNRLFPTGPSERHHPEKRVIRLVSVQENNRSLRTCDYITVTIYWLEADPENCTCTNPANCDWTSGCNDCSNSFSTSLTYGINCSGGGGGSPGGGASWDPYPPPGGGGGSTIGGSSGPWFPYPDDPTYQNFVNYTLNSSQQAFWNNPSKAGYVTPLVNILVQGNYSYQSQSTVLFWLNYLMSTSTGITVREFQNYFMYKPEGSDGFYNSTYWDDPNLSFTPATLPTLDAYRTAFPKIVNPDNTISPMSPDDVYDLVGGNMDYQHDLPNPDYQNACAIRGSRGLNYCGHTITAAATATELGSDGKRYILTAKAFNKYMNKKYGAPTSRLTSADINGNPDNIVNFLRGKNGIYTMVTTNGATFTGHVDLILNGECLGGSATFDLSIVDYIEIWELQ